jgi:hypothetical protein
VNYQADRIEDRLGPHEPRYRSRGEAQVGRLLDRHGIPFLYEQPTLIHDDGRHRVWHPDFTLPDLASRIVEYAGMPDVPEYARSIQYKQRVYRDNGIVAVFVYPYDLTGPSWPEQVLKRILEPYPADGAYSPQNSHNGRR